MSQSLHLHQLLEVHLPLDSVLLWLLLLRLRLRLQLLRLWLRLRLHLHLHLHLHLLMLKVGHHGATTVRVGADVVLSLC